jgi:hypothetical protein
MGTAIVMVLLLVPVLAVFLWWKLFNTPEGERYLKMRMQGLFVPSDSDDKKPDEPPRGLVCCGIGPWFSGFCSCR